MHQILPISSFHYQLRWSPLKSFKICSKIHNCSATVFNLCNSFVLAFLLLSYIIMDVVKQANKLYSKYKKIEYSLLFTWSTFNQLCFSLFERPTTMIRPSVCTKTVQTQIQLIQAKKENFILFILFDWLNVQIYRKKVLFLFFQLDQAKTNLSIMPLGTNRNKGKINVRNNRCASLQACFAFVAVLTRLNQVML